ncbi:hypothetical protein KDK_37410 [Dictyobacter kobayashii]|uniref:Uncharacterized protein n=1 Tax=Dictyobacter kobayashii TaxID=2014872 RepID=A0A402ALD4_9CHLR|nr:hypothetical protein KDK_37410 [Dictyobacter kobayashii]
MWLIALIPVEGHFGGGAPVDIKNLAGDKVCGIRSQEGDCGGNIFRAAYTPQGNKTIAKVGGIVRNVGITWDLNQSRTNRVNTDMAGCQLNGKLTCEGDNGPLVAA